jgi:hypothetical protein
MIEVPILYTVDVACRDCDCKKAVHAHKLEPSGRYTVQEDKLCSCGNGWPRHEFVRQTKSKAQMKRDREI